MGICDENVERIRSIYELYLPTIRRRRGQEAGPVSTSDNSCSRVGYVPGPRLLFPDGDPRWPRLSSGDDVSVGLDAPPSAAGGAAQGISGRCAARGLRQPQNQVPEFRAGLEERHSHKIRRLLIAGAFRGAVHSQRSALPGAPCAAVAGRRIRSTNSS